MVQVMLLLTALGEAFAQTATVVTRSGQRFRGQMADMSGGDAFTVRIDGRIRQVPVDAVALIDFVGDGRSLPQREVARANQSTDGFVVLRSGRTLVANVVDLFSNRLVVSGGFGEREVPLSQIARICLPDRSGYDAEGGLYGLGESRGFDPYEQRGIFDGGYASRMLTIPTDQTWTGTGISVTRGQRIHFRASGTVRLSENGDDYGTPAGANSGRLAGKSPLPNVTGGMLIGRVGSGRPFVIGAETEITMPATGELFLGINDDYVRDNSGQFDVEITAQ
jgi:hypothetical protein